MSLTAKVTKGMVGLESDCLKAFLISTAGLLFASDCEYQSLPTLIDIWKLAMF